MRLFFQIFSGFLGLVLISPISMAASPLFARLSIDRSAPYAGEAFQLTLRIYIAGADLDKQIQVSGFPQDTGLQLNGFEELPLESMTMDGLTYEVRSFKSWARLRDPGTITLAPLLEGTRIQTVHSHFFMQESRTPVRIMTEPLNIRVRPLPNTVLPAAFSGLVGRFKLSVMAVPLDIASGDLITLTVTVSGDWLPTTYTPPCMLTGAGLKAYESKLIPEESSSMKQTFRQVVVSQGEYVKELPAVYLTYFDTDKGAFVTETKGPFTLSYHADKAPAPAFSAPGTASALTSTVSRSAMTVPTPATHRPFWQSWFGPLECILRGSEDIPIHVAPSDESRVLFAVPSGTTVTVESQTEDWLRVECHKGIGWTRKANAGQ